MLKTIGASVNSDFMDVDRVYDKGGKSKKGDKGPKGVKGKPFKGEHGKKGPGKGFQKDGGKHGGKPLNKGGKGEKGDSGKKWGGKNSKATHQCWKCGKFGHHGCECRSQINQVQREGRDDSSSVQTRDSSTATTTASTASSSGSRTQLRRVHVVDLEQLGEDTEYYDMRHVCEVLEVPEPELPSTSVQLFEIGSENEDSGDEGDCVGGPDHVRVVMAAPLEGVEHEVILDSGADCTVLPLDAFQGVGQDSQESSVLLDAQGNRIPQGQVRAAVVFEVDGDGGDVIQFKDRVVLAQVRQPLFCFGKLLRDCWTTELDPRRGWRLRKGDRSFPVHWSKNSLATRMRIRRVDEGSKTRVEETHGVITQPMEVRLLVEISEDLEMHTKAPGWSLSADMLPVHMGMNFRTTLDASTRFDPQEWPHRTTLLHRGGRKYEFFECGEHWADHKEKDFETQEAQILTILSKNCVEPHEVGKVLRSEPGLSARERPEDPQENPLRDSGPEERGAGPEEHPHDAGPVALLGPSPVEVVAADEEALVVNGERLTELSPLRELRLACRFLGVSKNGSKAVVWQRVKREVAHRRLQVEVEASEAVQAEYSREPLVDALPNPPSLELVELHEVTHLPRADWCEACIAARSREELRTSRTKARVSRDFA